MASSLWIFEYAKIGGDYSSSEEATIINRQIHHIYKRTRYLTRENASGYNPLEGTISVPSAIASYNGSIEVTPKSSQKLTDGTSVSIKWYCSDDQIEPIPGSAGIFKQTQTWEFWGELEQIDISLDAITSASYTDNTAYECPSGTKSDHWKLLEHNPGFDHYYERDSEGETAGTGFGTVLVYSTQGILKRREHHIFIRKRDMKTVSLFSSQDGQTGDSDNIFAYDGGIKIECSDGLHLCTLDEISPYENGSEMFSQRQIWEFWGEASEVDLEELIVS
jgi:hypothetical protein